MIRVGPVRNIGVNNNSQATNGIFLKIRGLAGKTGNDPVFRQCMYCRRWQMYDKRPHDKWLNPLIFEDVQAGAKEKLADLAEKSKMFPAVSHGICPPCEKVLDREILAVKVSKELTQNEWIADGEFEITKNTIDHLRNILTDNLGYKVRIKMEIIRAKK